MPYRMYNMKFFIRRSLEIYKMIFEYSARQQTLADTILQFCSQTQSAAYLKNPLFQNARC